MKIGRVVPKPPPEITLTFSVDEGWAIVAALRMFADQNPAAKNVREWRQWASDLDKELRR